MRARARVCVCVFVWHPVRVLARFQRNAGGMEVCVYVVMRSTHVYDQGVANCVCGDDERDRKLVADLGSTCKVWHIVVRRQLYSQRFRAKVLCMYILYKWGVKVGI